MGSRDYILLGHFLYTNVRLAYRMTSRNRSQDLSLKITGSTFKVGGAQQRPTTNLYCIKKLLTHESLNAETGLNTRTKFIFPGSHSLNLRNASANTLIYLRRPNNQSQCGRITQLCMVMKIKFLFSKSAMIYRP